MASLKHGLEIQAIEEELNKFGYWYPPDAIRAVLEGRGTYCALDERTTYELRDKTKEIIAAIERARKSQR